MNTQLHDKMCASNTVDRVLLAATYDGDYVQHAFWRRLKLAKLTLGK